MSELNAILLSLLDLAYAQLSEVSGLCLTQEPHDNVWTTCCLKAYELCRILEQAILVVLAGMSNNLDAISHSAIATF